MKKLIVIIICLLTVKAFAEVPNEITYQGKLKEYGLPVTGTRTMNFKIYNAATGPGMQWESGDVSVNVSSGIFTNTLNPNVDWRIKDLWIETVISGKTLAPREKITSQAYALHARTAEDLSKPTGSEIKFAIGNSVNTTINSAGEISNLHDGTTYYMIPRGAIIMWSGSISSIPIGWSLCDGANGTPDLRDKFVVGAGNTYSCDSFGGTVTHSHTMPNHNHSITHNHNLTIDAHSHDYSGTTSTYNPEFNAAGGGTTASPAHSHTYSGATSSVVTNGSTGLPSEMNSGNVSQEANSSNSLPPYYALAFIIKR